MGKGWDIDSVEKSEGVPMKHTKAFIKYDGQPTDNTIYYFPEGVSIGLLQSIAWSLDNVRHTVNIPCQSGPVTAIYDGEKVQITLPIGKAPRDLEFLT